MSPSSQAHRIRIEPSRARVRARLAGATVADTRRALILREGSLAPVYYVPLDDVARDHLVPTDRITHCPFKGDAAYYSIRVGDREATNAVWTYPEPLDAVAAIAGHVAFYTDRLDAFDVED